MFHPEAIGYQRQGSGKDNSETPAKKSEIVPLSLWFTKSRHGLAGSPPPYPKTDSLLIIAKAVSKLIMNLKTNRHTNGFLNEYSS